MQFNRRPDRGAGSLPALALALAAFLAALSAGGVGAKEKKPKPDAKPGKGQPATPEKPDPQPEPKKDVPKAEDAGGPATQRLVFANYYYSFQGDRRKQLPFQGVRDAKGVSLLTDHPWESVGPWLSYDRAQWHKNQFQMMAAGGIDVALAVYRGDRASRRSYAIKGLDVMVQGLKELRDEGLTPFVKAREHPQIGLALDLHGLADQYGGPVNLKQADVQKSLYGMVRDFYLHVPEEFRATVQLPPSRLSSGDQPATASTPNGAAYVVRLLGDSAVVDADAAFVSAVNRRFMQEFGARLLWIGTPDLRKKVPSLDAVAPAPAVMDHAVVNRAAWIGTGSLGPGFDNTSQGQAGSIRPRENGQGLVSDFKAVMAASPEWIFIDSWNDYGRGSDVAPTLEYGLLYRDLVRGAVLQYKQSADYAVNFLKASVPRVMEPGKIYQVEVAAQNSGTSDWDAFNVASLSYRWIRNGEYVGDPGANVASNGQVRGDVKSYMIAVTSPISESKALPPGQYDLELNVTRRVGAAQVWFDQDETAPFRIPVTIGAAQPARPYWITSTMTTMARRGAAYPAEVRLRNDGSDTWKKGQVSIGYRWRKVSTYLKGASEDSDTVIAEGKRVPIDGDVPPGRLLTLDVPVSTVDGSGQPLPTWSPQDDWCYVLEWDLYEGSKPLSQAGAATSREVVEIFDRDPAPFFLGCSLSTELVAGKTEKITVGLINKGPEVWKKDRDKVIVHWFYMDGTEASWNDGTLPLQHDVAPYSEAEIQIPDDLESLLRAAPKREGDGATPEKPEKPGKHDRPASSAKPDKSDRSDQPDRSDDGDGKPDKKSKKKGKFHTEKINPPTILRDVPVQVPYYFGPMYCVFDFQHDGLNASTGPASKGNDLMVIPVNIYSPTFTPLPISAFFNVDGISQDVDRSDGNIDGRRNSLPAEFLPPYVARPSVGTSPAPSPLFPSGLWVRPLNDLDSSRTCFLYPSKENRLPNMIACQGQQIRFGPLSRTAVHVMALSTEEEQEGVFTLYYADGGKDTKKFTFTHWNDAPKHGERIAFSIAHRHTPAGDDPNTRCYINHYTIPTDRLRPLIAVELPNNPAIKVMAVTLESSSFKGN